MAKNKLECFGFFMENMDNPNCDVCHLRSDCYNEWNKRDKEKKLKQAEAEKPWYEKKPLTELFPEACERCEKGS